jgi:DNA-binding NarL/FixJ family response regulator
MGTQMSALLQPSHRLGKAASTALLDRLGPRQANRTATAKLERHLAAAALQVVAEWLAEQARMLTDESAPEAAAAATEWYTAFAGGVPNVRGRPLSPAFRRRPAAEVDRSVTALTPREREVAAGIARGLSNNQIARELVIAVSTTERHVANILMKLDMVSRVQIALWATQNGLGSIEG